MNEGAGSAVPWGKSATGSPRLIRKKFSWINFTKSNTEGAFMPGRQRDARPNARVKQGSTKPGCRQTSPGDMVLPRRGGQGRRAGSFG